MNVENGFKHWFEDSNRLIGGNSDNGGLTNVNHNWSDNHNDNIAFRPLIDSHCLAVLIQPPSILPTSIRYSARCWYFLLSIHLVSEEILSSIFRRSSLILVFCKTGSFCSWGRYPAVIINSTRFKATWSIFNPRVYFLLLGKRKRTCVKFL